MKKLFWRAEMSETCSIRDIDNYELDIKIPSKLTTTVWFEQMGFIQKEISQFNRSKVTVDFSNCVWADPFPLMSLSLSLKYFAKHEGNVSIIIPFFEKDHKNTDASKFLKFLAQEGFLKEFCISFFVSNGKENISLQDINGYLSIDTKLTYTDSELLPFSIIDLASLNFKEDICDYVDKIIEQQISIKLSSKVSDNVYKKTLSNIFHCLCELIENVKVHAYDGINEQYFGVYVRYRKGINTNKAGEINPEMTKQLHTCINDERKNCPSLDNDILLNADSIVEIFVVDVGIGLLGSLAKEYTYPARELFRLVLKDGLRKKQTKAMSAYGGLYFITRLLEENGGYIWCKNQDELVGGYGAEILDKNSNRIRSTIDLAKEHVPGLCWCVRLSCTEESNFKGAYYKLFSGVATEHPAYKAYCRETKCYDFPRLFCVDDRKIIENCATITKSKEELIFVDRDSKAVFNQDPEVEEYFWFPKDKMTKNILIFELKKYMEYFINVFELSPIEQKELTIFDVPNSQLLTYYNALNSLNSTWISADHINKITIIGEHYEFMCFSKVNGVFKYANDTINEASQEFSNQLYEKVDLLRKYDSFIFWTLINKYNTDNLLYISDKIKWTNNLTLNGYLDFDNLYSFAPFLNLLIKTLERVKGLFYNTRVTLCNIDDISKRLCNEVNGTYSYSEKYNMNFVNVGSVWVSGYKKNAFAIENAAKFDVHFFLHNDCLVENSCEAFLLIWANGSITPRSTSESVLWKRLGRTNLIGKISQEPIIIDSSTDYYKNSSRGKINGYYDLQNKYPTIAKIGHYSTDNHHYFLAFDFFPIIKLSYFQREGLFLYLLCQIFFRLVEDGNHNNIVEEMIKNGNKAWVDIIKKQRSKYSNIEKVNIVLYHSNSYTEYAINYIKQVFPDALNSKILPVNLHSVQKKGMPPVLSVNTIGKILNIINASKKESNNVLYFDSNISSGQTINRIRNILSSATDRELKFSSLSILDTQRLPRVDPTTNTYWKFNMPRMEKIEECVLCSSLEKAKTFQSMVILDCRVRINEWFIAWNPIGVSKNAPGAGLLVEPIAIEKKQAANRAVITNSMGKIMQVVECVCETYENDYAVRICANDKTISESIKIQILCAQVILYGNQSTRNIQQNIILLLMQYMAHSSISKNCSSLAALILLSQEESIMYNVFNEVYKSEQPEIEALRIIIDKATNIDFIMVVAYFIKMSKSISELSITLSSSFADSIIRKARDVLLADRDFKNICKEFHGLLFNDNGGNHNVEIKKTLSEKPDNFRDFKNRYERVKGTIVTLCEYAEILPSVYQNKIPKEQYFLSAMITTLKSNLFSAIDSDIPKKEKEYGYISYNPNTRIDISPDVRTKLTEIYEQFKNLHASYFICDCMQTKEYLLDMVAQRGRKYSKRIKINYPDDKIVNSTETSRIEQKWYFWNSSIETEFEYLLDNVEHAEMQFEDDDEEVNMILDVCFSRNELNLSTTSFSDKIAFSVQEDFTMKNRLQKEQATQFDVIFDFTNPDNNTEKVWENNYKLKSEMLIPAVFGNYIRR